MSVTEGSILKSIVDCDRRIADADRELERLRGCRAAKWQERDQFARSRTEAKDNPAPVRPNGNKFPRRKPGRCPIRPQRPRHGIGQR
jgi:hypothetical protein